MVVKADIADGEAPAALYAARVMHRRRVAPLYRFVYRLFYLLWDIDRIDEALRGRWLVSHNRFNLLAVYDCDHGDGSVGGLRRWADAQLAAQGIGSATGRIRLLALPRVLGYAFNPIALWYCDGADGRLRAVIAEVRNTFGERHAYVLDYGTASAAGADPYQQQIDKHKCFHVSPFFDVVGRYRFALSEPGERLRVAIHETRDGQPLLDATLAAERIPLRDASVLKAVLGTPWMTVKVVAAIHWQALKLWLRGARFHRKPVPPAEPVS